MTEEYQIKHEGHKPEMRVKTVKGIPTLKLTLHQSVFLRKLGLVKVAGRSISS